MSSTKRKLQGVFGATKSPTSKALFSEDTSHQSPVQQPIVIPSQSFMSPARSLNFAATTNCIQTQKIFNDPVHQNIQLDALSQRIVDTYEYQRLSKLKQLGTCSFVFRGATHTRFEHSLGVCHLAERVVKCLQSNQPELKISEADLQCVKIAGLCHDLGHGPFSHVYDGVFIKRMYPNGLDEHKSKWRHEDGSVKMFQYLLAKNNINLQEFGLTEIDKLFIEEIIGGVSEDLRKGREENKFYLYDIVNNTRSGLDVDKLDYYQRDMKYANVVLTANFDRFIQLGRVLPSQLIEDLASPENALMICYPEKLVREAVDVFSVRFRMHHYVYGHKSVKQIEFMITDALQIADPFLKIRGTVTEKFPEGLYRMSECVFDMQALSNLNDSALDMIYYDLNPALDPARAILDRVNARQLYTCLGKTSFTRSDPIHKMSEDSIKKEILKIADSLLKFEDHGDSDTDDDDDAAWSSGFPTLHQTGFAAAARSSSSSTSSSSAAVDPAPPLSMSESVTVALTEHDIIVEKMHIHYGLKEKNPVARMRFFQKNGGAGATGRQVSEQAYETSLPRCFEEQAVRVFCRHQDKEGLARSAFEKWCRRAHTHSPFPSCSQQPNTQSACNSQMEAYSPPPSSYL